MLGKGMRWLIYHSLVCPHLSRNLIRKRKRFMTGFYLGISAVARPVARRANRGIHMSNRTGRSRLTAIVSLGISSDRVSGRGIICR